MQGSDPSFAAHCLGPSMPTFACTVCHLQITKACFGKDNLKMTSMGWSRIWYVPMWYTFSAAACKYCKRKKAGEYCCCHKLGPHCSNLKSWAHWNGRMGLGRLLYKVVWNKQKDGCWIFVGMIRLVFVLHWPDGWYCILLKYDGQMFYPKISGQSQLLRFHVLD